MKTAPWTYVDDVSDPQLSLDEIHHLVNVKRVSEGGALVLSDGKGSWAEFIVSKVSKARTGALYLERQSEIMLDPLPKYPVGVALFMPKLDRLSWALQKMCEVGVDEIQLLSEAFDRRGGKPPSMDRLRRVVREAGAQSRRSRLPLLSESGSLADLINREEVALCDINGGPLRPSHRTLVVGPEAGIKLTHTHCEVVKLPGGVLRTETAAVVSGALMVSLRENLVGEIDQAWRS